MIPNHTIFANLSLFLKKVGFSYKTNNAFIHAPYCRQMSFVFSTNGDVFFRPAYANLKFNTYDYFKKWGYGQNI